ncbi:coiled-coil domain-containing protein 158-like [Lampris incognitus]|uniref:coiled-coil domain-containing protein 158-like n=1 Tax=Lampris incognitus TaxID=2546036 RepID=UPI0024B5BE74|nr:coiled-coil domain-containing protein 158-like [Lampris incognitus]
MSLGLENFGPQTKGIFVNNDADVSHSEDADGLLHHTKVARAATETRKTSTPPRPNSLKLQELSEELDRRTKETQRLQEEVENATKRVLQRVGCTYSIEKRQQSCHLSMYNVDLSPGVPDVRPAHQEPVIQPLSHVLEGLTQRGIGFPGKEVLESAIEDYSQQVSLLQRQLGESYGQHEQQKIQFHQTIIKLQTKLQEVQMENAVLSDLRMADSSKHASQIEKMQEALCELQSAKQSSDQKLQEMEDKARSLSGKAKSMERTIREVYTSLVAHNKHYEDSTVAADDAASSPWQLPLEVFAAKVVDKLEHENNRLRERLSLLGNDEQKYQGKLDSMLKEQKDRMEQLIAKHDQEVALLTDKLICCENNGTSLQVKLLLLQKQVETQQSLHQCQVTELESSLSFNREKVGSLEEQLTQALSQMEEAQKERDQSLHQVEELNSQLVQLKRCSEQQRWELQEEVRTLRGQLEAWEQLLRAGEEEAHLQVLLGQRAQESRKTQTLLEEREEELRLRQQEALEVSARLVEVQGQCQVLWSEAEMLKLKLDDREKVVEIVRLQMESGSQMLAQHGHTMDSLHWEKSHLTNQLNQQKLELQQLKAELGQGEAVLAALEQERSELQTSLAEQSHSIQQAALEKRRLTGQLDAQSRQLVSLTEEHKELQRLHSSEKEDHEAALRKLKNQLKNALSELDRARSSLRTLEGADGHGLQVAMGMQKQITARRDQIDSLQGRIQQLEESTEKLHQEKRYQSLEGRRRAQELASAREETRRLLEELEALRSKERRHTERVAELETALHKISDRFADRQDFIQLQEQEFVRLKLQHALDLKELQGQNLRTAVGAPSTPSSSQPVSKTRIELKSQGLPENSALELRSLVRELRGVISENHHRPHTDSHRRRSAPERTARTSLWGTSDTAVTSSKLPKEIHSNEPQLLRTAELNDNHVTNNFSKNSRVMSRLLYPARYTSSPQPVLLGRRSPVHSLLTSNPNTELFGNKCEGTAALSSVLT